MPIGRYPDIEKNQEDRQSIENKKESDKEFQWNVSEPRHRLEDLILANGTKTQIMDVVSYFQNQELLFRIWGLEERYGQQDGLAVNLYGSPGTGKTMAAHAIAHELDMSMICVDYAEIESKYVGETAKNLSSLFKSAVAKNAVIFFDEADALLSKRVTNMTSASDVSVNQTRSVLLNLLNDYRGVILFATNFIQNFDAAFLRRIRYHVQFHLPDCTLREILWRTYIPPRMPCEVDYGSLSKKYENISGSDIANAVFSAAVAAARNRELMVSQLRFEQAIEAIIKVKRANANVTVSTEIVSEEEVKKALGKKKEEAL